MGNHVNKSSYLNLLPKEVRLNIADKLKFNQFINFDEYLTDIVDTDYITILKEYNVFTNIINLMGCFHELQKLHTWEDVYICTKINSDRIPSIHVEMSRSREIARIYDKLSPFFFLFDLKIENPTFYNEIMNICLDIGKGISSWRSLGESLRYIRTKHRGYYEELISGNFSGVLPAHIHSAVSSNILIYYLIGKKNSKMKWDWCVDSIYNHYSILRKLLGLKTTDWIENIDDATLKYIYIGLQNDDACFIWCTNFPDFKSNATKLIKSELIRRDLFYGYFEKNNVFV